MDKKISLIIPVKDEACSIALLLESVRRQTRQPDEIVIADAGSRDGTVEIIEAFRKAGLPIRLVRMDRAYPGTARNAAIEAAANPLIAMTDGGIRLDRSWLAELKRALDSSGADIVYGHYEPLAGTFFKKCLAVVFVPPAKAIGGARIRGRFIASSLMRKGVWSSVGGFPDLRAAEDRIFMERVDAKGFKVAYAPGARVSWDIPSDLRETFRRFSTLSFHDLKAGRSRDWHRRVTAMYAVGGACLILGVFVSPWVFLVPAAGLLARSLTLIRERAGRFPGPAAAALVTVLIVWIDLAMFWGAVRYLAGKMRRRVR